MRKLILAAIMLGGHCRRMPRTITRRRPSSMTKSRAYEFFADSLRGPGKYALLGRSARSRIRPMHDAAPPVHASATNQYSQEAEVNVGRGAFRLWVVFSVLWVGLFIVISGFMPRRLTSSA